MRDHGSIWPGRTKGAGDTVKRKRRGKTPGEVAATVAKKAVKADKARIEKSANEKAARSALVASLRRGREKDDGEGPSVPMAAASLPDPHLAAYVGWEGRW